MKKLLALAAMVEAVTGLALLVAPSLVGRLIFGAEGTGVAISVTRVFGIALIALGIACWPSPALFGMLIYGALVTAYLLYLACGGEWIGFLLWPAVVVLHAVLTLLLAGLVQATRQETYIIVG
jgi:hypothetical protein